VIEDLIDDKEEKKSFNLEELLKLYKAELEIQGQTPRTIKTYTFFIKKFLEFLQKKGVDPYSLEKRHLKEFLLRTHAEKNYSIKSLYNLILALKSFLRFLEREDLVKSLKLPKLPKSLPKALTKEEIRRLIDAADNLRDKLIIILFYALLYFAFDFVYMPYKKVYMGSKEDFNKSLIQIFLQYRMLTGFFAIFPYITLLIINN